MDEYTHLIYDCQDMPTKPDLPWRGMVQNERGTADLARRFGLLLTGGELVLLRGPLGSGKTTFIRSLVKSLGVKSAVRSPTFTILNRYALGAGPIRCLVHVDGYRIKSWQDLQRLGLFEYLNLTDTVVLVEWPPRGKLPIIDHAFVVLLRPMGLRKREYEITRGIGALK